MIRVSLVAQLKELYFSHVVLIRVPFSLYVRLALIKAKNWGDVLASFGYWVGRLTPA